MSSQFILKCDQCGEVYPKDTPNLKRSSAYGYACPKWTRLNEWGKPSCNGTIRKVKVEGGK